MNLLDCSQNALCGSNAQTGTEHASEDNVLISLIICRAMKALKQFFLSIFFGISNKYMTFDIHLRMLHQSLVPVGRFSCAARSRSTRLKSFPLGLFGRASTNSMPPASHLYRDFAFATCYFKIHNQSLIFIPTSFRLLQISRFSEPETPWGRP